MKKPCLKENLFWVATTLPLLLAACGSNPTTDVKAKADTKTSMATLAKVVKTHNNNTKWFIELEADPITFSAQSIGSQQASFRAQAKAAGIQYTERYQFKRLFNGFSVVTNQQGAIALSHLAGVKAVYPVEFFPAPQLEIIATPANNETAALPEMFYAKELTGVARAAKELNLTGKGVKVGVIDTGVDLNHPALKNRVKAGYDFVGDLYGSEDENGQPFKATPSDKPQDCQGHGTHVAGIVGGYDPNYTREGLPFSGVAPEVDFGIYRVFGCSGGTDEDVLIAAMEKASQDGMQVVNISIGTAFNSWAERGSALAANRLAKKGVIVVASAGNAGEYGTYTMGGAGMGEQVIAVASVDNAYIEATGISVKNGKDYPYAYSVGAAKIKDEWLPLGKSQNSNPTATKDGCEQNDFDTSIKGKIALIRRGGCDFLKKAQNAQLAGAAGIIFYNDRVNDYTNPLVLGIKIPVVMVDEAFGIEMDKVANTGIEVNLHGNIIPIPNPSGGFTSFFSSLGMSAELDLKPEITAPGGKILSAYITTKSINGYEVISGTSMASPHVAGAAALLLQANPQIQAKEMRTLMMNTAQILQPYINESENKKRRADYVQRQGAGLLDIVNAYKATKETPVNIYPPKLNLLDSAKIPRAEKVLTVSNNSDRPINYSVKHLPSFTVGDPSHSPQRLPASAFVSVNGQSIDEEALNIVVPAHGKTELNVSITPPEYATNLSQYGGYIQLTAQDAPRLTVPFSGMKGDYQSMRIFTDIKRFQESIPTPILYDAYTKQEYVNGSEPDIMPDYSFKDIENDLGQFIDEPLFLIHLNHQVRKLKVDIINEREEVMRAHEEDYKSRNCSNDLNAQSIACSTYFSYSWDGKVNGNPVPNGIYKVRFTVIKPLADVENPGPDGQEVYTSPSFKIIR